MCSDTSKKEKNESPHVETKFQIVTDGKLPNVEKEAQITVLSVLGCSGTCVV